MTRRPAQIILGLVLLVLVLALFRLAIGPAGSGGGVAFAFPETAEGWRLRIDRVWCGIGVGAGLAIAGVLLQALLRNPLASPDLIGPTAGAGLAVMLASAIGATSAAVGYHGALGAIDSAAALLGSLAALALVYTLAQRRGLVEPVSLVLVGVMVSVICGAATVLIANLTPDRGLAVSRWMIGTLPDAPPRTSLVILSGLVVAALLISLRLSRALDVASLEDDEARSLGVHVGRLRLIALLLSGVLTAACVVIAGPIGFVGLVCPHAARLLLGPAHRAVIPASALAGAGLILAADILVRALDLGTGRLPIGVITALVGGPVFLLMLRRGAVMR